MIFFHLELICLFFFVVFDVYQTVKVVWVDLFLLLPLQTVSQKSLLKENIFFICYFFLFISTLSTFRSTLAWFICMLLLLFKLYLRGHSEVKHKMKIG